MRRFTVTLLLSLSLIPAFAQQHERKPYAVADGYEIFSSLLPQEEASRFAKGTLVIQQETVLSELPKARCITPEVAKEFREAIADFERINRTQWLLQRQFVTDKPYELVNEDTLAVVFKEGEWDALYKRYPESGGYTAMSAVGFSTDRSMAIVYSRSRCGLLCGRRGFHLFKKQQGKWNAFGKPLCDYLN